MGNVGALRDGRPEGHSDDGTAARFFPSFRYIAKASGAERDAGVRVDARHTTVKPIEVMRWLVRLVTPPGGVVLDPFCGSGTTGCAAMVEGFDFVGCEREPEYAALSRERIAWWAEHGAASVEAWSSKRAREIEDEATGQLSLLGG